MPLLHNRSFLVSDLEDLGPDQRARLLEVLAQETHKLAAARADLLNGDGADALMQYLNGNPELYEQIMIGAKKSPSELEPYPAALFLDLVAQSNHMVEEPLEFAGKKGIAEFVELASVAHPLERERLLENTILKAVDVEIAAHQASFQDVVALLEIMKEPVSVAFPVPTSAAESPPPKPSPKPRRLFRM